jgi:hypothetical protein
VTGPDWWRVAELALRAGSVPVSLPSNDTLPNRDDADAEDDADPSVPRVATSEIDACTDQTHEPADRAGESASSRRLASLARANMPSAALTTNA